jgi:hypothetical protein
MGSLLSVISWHGLAQRTLAVSLRRSYERGFRGGTVFSARRRAA